MSFLRKIFLTVFAASLSAAAVTFFQKSLNVVTEFREFLPGLVFLLPVAGLVIGFFNQRFGRLSGGGVSLVLYEMAQTQKILSWITVPLIYVGTLLSHLVGASTGREGAALQIGATLADQVSPFISLAGPERQLLLKSALVASFGTALAAPVAGIVFVWEFSRTRRWRSLPYLLVAAIIGQKVSVWLQVPHTVWRIPTLPDWQLTHVWGLPGLVLAFAFIASLYLWLHHHLDQLGKRWVSSPALRTALAGSALLAFYWGQGETRYAGLGIPVIEGALSGVARDMDSWFKMGTTLLSTALGFKGGEFTALVFIGSTAGVTLAQILPFTPEFLAALGFVSVFAAVTGAPLTMAVVAAEIFLPGIFPWALIVTVLTNKLTRGVRLYSAN